MGLEGTGRRSKYIGVGFNLFALGDFSAREIAT